MFLEPPVILLVSIQNIRLLVFKGCMAEVFAAGEVFAALTGTLLAVGFALDAFTNGAGALGTDIAPKIGAPGAAADTGA